MLSSLILPQDPMGQLPPAASTFAGDVDGLFYFLFWVSLFFFALILGLLVYSAVKHRRKTIEQPAVSNVTHNTPLEVVWTLIPTIILMVIFAWGFKGSQDQLIAPADALQYRVQAQKWSWTFFHPESSTPVPNEVWVPRGKPVLFRMTSSDVLHSFFIPAFRVKRDVVPGVQQLVWFEATETDDYDLFCAEYCGEGHSLMRATVHVVEPEYFDTKPWPEVPDDPIAAGEYYYKGKCSICHSTDGTRVVGPSFQGLWGRQGTFESGESYVVDEAYVRNSIRNPMSQIVSGYPAGMTAFSEAMLSDEAITNIIEWMKTLK